MSLVGYARVSTSEGAQVLDRQLDALGQAGCERIFEDNASGADVERPGWRAVWTTCAGTTFSSSLTSIGSDVWRTISSP